LKIDLKWERPFRLKDGARFNLIYNCSGLNHVLSKPGLYIFARRYGRSIVPLYVGQALKLRGRIEQQFNNLKLMMAVKGARSGHRILLVGRLRLHPGQQKKKVLDIVESALIKHALAQGHDLINQHGTKTSVHTIRSKGNTSSKQIAPRTMLVERRKGN
jgi:hypothetical protein